MSSTIKIPKEIEDLLNKTSSTQAVDLAAPLHQSLSQRTIEIIKKRGLGFDLDWWRVVEQMSEEARKVVVADTIVEKLKAFAVFDLTWLMAQLSYTTIIMPSTEKMTYQVDQYKTTQTWYETLMELLMANILSILGGDPEQLSLFLTDILEIEISRAEGKKISDSKIEAMTTEYLTEVNRNV